MTHLKNPSPLKKKKPLLLLFFLSNSLLMLSPCVPGTSAMALMASILPRRRSLCGSMIASSSTGLSLERIGSTSKSNSISVSCHSQEIYYRLLKRRQELYYKPHTYGISTIYCYCQSCVFYAVLAYWSY